METFKKISPTELEITEKIADKIVVESFDATLAQISELESAVAELNEKLVPLYARRDEGIKLGLKTKYEVDEDNRIAEEARQQALKDSLDEEV